MESRASSWVPESRQSGRLPGSMTMSHAAKQPSNMGLNTAIHSRSGPGRLRRIPLVRTARRRRVCAVPIPRPTDQGLFRSVGAVSSG